MKPMMLEMEGFGSYLEHTTIDFSRISRGLYLITGPTGSGKTTIFDAICFALYGGPSGSTRTENLLRSRNAGPDVPTYVDLTFSYAGKIFRIRRNPSYMRRARHGDGVVEEKSGVCLELPDGRTLTKITAANRYIAEDVMHISREQFSRIAMLAQGEFQKLLVSDTKDKMAIFRQIFGTALYDDLAQGIGVERKKVSKEREKLEVAIDQEIERVPVDMELGEEMEAELGKVRDRSLSMEDSIAVLEKALEALSSRYSGIGTVLDQLSARELELAERGRKLKDLHATAARIAECSSGLPRLERNSEEAEKAYAEAEKMNGECKKALQLKVSEQERKIRDIREVDKVAEEIDEAVSALHAEETKLDGELSRIESDRKKLGSIKQLVDSIEDRTDEMMTLRDRIGDASRQKLELDEASRLLEASVKAGKDAETAQCDFCRIRTDFEAARSSYDEAYDVFYSQQAGILASHLMEGKPCPVCGSLEHPQKALVIDENITDAELRRRKDMRDRKDRLMTEASGKANVAEERFRAAENALDEKLSFLGISGDDALESVLKDRRNRLDADISAWKESVDCINADNVRRNRAISEMDRLGGTIRDRESSIDSLRSEVDAARGSIKARTEALADARSRLGDLDADELQESNRKLSSEIMGIERRFREAAAVRSKAESDLTRIRTSLDSLQEHVKTLDMDDGSEDELQATLDDVRSRKVGMNDVRMKLNTSISIVSSIIAGLRGNKQRYDEVSRLHDSINMLYMTFSGQLSGKRKVSLETYVQMAYFDRILARANVRLLSMTSGRYEMRREKIEDIDNIQGSRGLDVMIVDHYEGCERAVQTLSGGEKFLASLCLALGLSEEIESEAGGVHLDSIFIDEGFGSLDSESISLAMKALSDLAAGNKMVGIISHVEALGNRIDRKIVVTRNLKGESRAVVMA